MVPIRAFLFGGGYGTGKNHVSRCIAEHLRGHTESKILVVEEYFARFLKDSTALLRDVLHEAGIDTKGEFEDEHIYGDTKTYLSRRFQQVIGTEVLRSIDPNIHAHMLVKRLMEHLLNDIPDLESFDEIVVNVTDLRYDNEYEALLNAGVFDAVIPVKLTAPEEFMKHVGANASTHASENSLKGDYPTYHNDRSLDGKDLAMAVYGAIKEWHGNKMVD